MNTDDAPELTDEFFERADEYRGDVLVRRGRDYFGGAGAGTGAGIGDGCR